MYTFCERLTILIQTPRKSVILLMIHTKIDIMKLGGLITYKDVFQICILQTEKNYQQLFDNILHLIWRIYAWKWYWRETRPGIVQVCQSTRPHEKTTLKIVKWHQQCRGISPHNIVKILDGSTRLDPEDNSNIVIWQHDAETRGRDDSSINPQ